MNSSILDNHNEVNNVLFKCLNMINTCESEKHCFITQKYINQAFKNHSIDKLENNILNSNLELKNKLLNVLKCE